MRSTMNFNSCRHSKVCEFDWIAGANQRFKARANECGRPAAEYCLLAENVGLRLLTRSGLKHAGTRAADSFCPGQSCLLGVAAGILMNCDQSGCATSPHKLPAHHRSQPFGSDHHNIDIFARDNRAVMNCESMREKQGLART